MLSGDSRSYNFGSGGVDTLRFDAVVDGTTLPEIDRPFAPNGTGGLRMPKREQNIIRLINPLNFDTLLTYPCHLIVV